MKKILVVLILFLLSALAFPQTIREATSCHSTLKIYTNSRTIRLIDDDGNVLRSFDVSLTDSVTAYTVKVMKPTP